MKKKKQFIEYEDGTRVELDDDDAPELDAAWFKTAKHGLDGLAELIGEEAVAPLRKVGRPKSPSPKRNGTLRLSAEIWDGIKASGKGYNARVEAILRAAIQEGRI
ncbi:MAG: BrnA antitoxin family protein [Alphaproteobacteria bacterium]